MMKKVHFSVAETLNLMFCFMVQYFALGDIFTVEMKIFAFKNF